MISIDLMVHTSSSSQRTSEAKGVRDKSRSWISIFSNPIRRKLCRMWTEASVETKHFAIAKDGSSVGQWFTWNFQASAQDSLLKKKAWQFLKAISFTSSHCADYGMCQYIWHIILYMIYNNKRNQCQKKKGKRTFRDHWQSKLDYNGVGISGAGLRLVDSGAPNDCKIFVRRSKYCLELSINWGRLKISRYPFHLCTSFDASLITIIIIIIIIIIIPLFTISSIYSTTVSGAEQMPETNNSNWT